MSARDASSLQAHASVLGLSQLTCFFSVKWIGVTTYACISSESYSIYSFTPLSSKGDLSIASRTDPRKLSASPYPSQDCSVCYYVDRANRPNQQTFCCRVCGYSTHAHLNAAIIIQHRWLDQSFSG